MQRLYYACRVRLSGANALLVWFQNERDGFVRRSDGRLLVAESREDLERMVAEMGFSLVSDDVTEYDLDRILQWCRTPTAEGIDCSPFLNAWNFFDDLAGLHDDPTSAYARLSRDASGCYDKLFGGCNLMNHTPGRPLFIPSWEPDELTTIQRVLEAGLALIAEELRRGADRA